SRRRHTRWPRDWSSDVCSSDLHLRGPTIRPDDVVARLEFSDPPPAEMSEHATRDRLRAAAHEPERCHLDRAALDHAPCAVEVDQIGRASCRGRGLWWGGDVVVE